ncbi:hypothetical protein [Gynurincola endophyticus]|uniref:hypothetical protein n=1 Tax=Gynurincola endophyticus TaxID=2479004 RepID=UPI000F8D6256|nr:hypothetical protein [Gynurincola endophyticus]
MLSPDQQDFYNRWLEKADNIVDGDVASLIDKYVTLFINYNFLYNIVPLKKAQETGNAREQVGDRAGATTFTINFVGAGAIAQYLTQQGLDDQIQALYQAMPLFNIDLNRGTPQPNRDRQLINGLQSADPARKILALMKTLYSIRCNIVHGEKGLHQYQEMLLLPAIQLLRAVVVFVHARVNT